MPVVIDDHLLLAALAGTEPRALLEAMASEAVYTTGCWYYRLARAASAGSGDGTLSRELANLEPESRARARASIGKLPDAVGILNQRTIVPVIAAIRVRRQLNMLNAEALAAAVVTNARLVVSVDSPLLTSGAADLGLAWQVVA